MGKSTAEGHWTRDPIFETPPAPVNVWGRERLGEHRRYGTLFLSVLPRRPTLLNQVCLCRLIPNRPHPGGLVYLGIVKAKLRSDEFAFFVYVAKVIEALKAP